MKRKTYINKLHELLEDSNNDVDIDINVIIESDDSADLINDAIEQVEDNVEINQMEEQSEAQEEEAETLQAVASILRKHGLNPGMAALLNVLLPMEAYGIILPATESLNGDLRNAKYADYLAAAFENGFEGLTFFEKIKKVFMRILSMMDRTFQRLISFFGSMSSRIIRMGKQIEGWYARNDKEGKTKITQLKIVNNWVNQKDAYPEIDWLTNALEVFNLEKITPEVLKFLDYLIKNKDKLEELEKHFVDWRAQQELKKDFDSSEFSKLALTDYSALLRERFPNQELKENLGCEWDEEKGYSLKIDNSFLDTTDTSEVDGKKAEGWYMTGSDNIYAYTLGICKLRDKFELARKGMNTFAKQFEKSMKIDLLGEDQNGEAAKLLKNNLTTLKEYISCLQKLFRRIYQVCTKICLNYLKCGRQLLANKIIDADAMTGGIQ